MSVGVSAPLVEHPLAMAESQPLLGDQAIAEADEAQRSNPEAVATREASETKYQDLKEEEAAKLAQETFPATIDDPAGGPPTLMEGQRITGFVNADVAQVDLGEGQHGVIESLTPMAIASSDGWSPVNLSLSESDGAFLPANPLVDLRVPTKVSDGIQLPEQGLSLTPIDDAGSPLGGSEGVVVGADAFYANTQLDTDTVIKPTTLGFDAIALLRSSASPQQLDYRVGLPEGASLVQEKDSGLVRVIKEGTTIASVPPPLAHDAAGSVVPVTMSASGDTLTLTVNRQPAEYAYPIDIDPEFNTTVENLTPTNWHFEEAEHHFQYSDEGGWLWISHKGSFPASNWAEVATQTNGDSRIYEVTANDSLWSFYVSGGSEGTYGYLDAYLEIHGTSESHPLTLSGYPINHEPIICAAEACSPAGGSEGNAVKFVVTTVESSSKMETEGHSEDLPYGGDLTKPAIYISQPKETHSTVEYNGHSPEIEYKSGGKTEKTINIIDDGSLWIGPRSPGAFEFESKDAGLGVSGTAVEVYKTSKWETALSKNYLTEEFACSGIQCSPAQHEVVTYGQLGGYLANGEDKIRVSAHDPMEHTSSTEHGEGEATLKVDTEAPHGITLTGLTSKGGEYQLGEVEAHVKAEATDGTGSVPSSGIKSLSLYVDGKEVGKAAGSCSRGPCTASAEWPINGAELGAGAHTLTVMAIDNADNYETKEYLLDVYSASPVALGPGSANPESGDFAMEATDVAVSGGMGSLAVTRHYDSRNPKEGEESSVGPQWTLSLGSLASLEVLPDGSVMVVGPTGLTHFSKKVGGFEAPTGDTNLTLKAEENGKKEIVAYLLEDQSDGTSTRFTLPTGAKSWMPTLSKGPVATDTMTDEYTTAEPEKGKKVIEPTLEVAPHPYATCEARKSESEPTRLEKGCRGLEFFYGKATTASGENKTQWGEYIDRLIKIKFIAWNTISKAMEETTVAEYSYDKQGRLRAEWNPSLPTALKTIYGYDEEGHITALTPPGQQPWLLHYGTTPGDASTGRILSVTRPSASTGAWNGESLKNTAAPTLSSSEANVGTSLSVTSNGSWSNGPLSYSYQWEDCSASGTNCSSINGATNAAYTPRISDEGYALVAEVTATSAGGSIHASTSPSSVIKAMNYSLKFGTKGEKTGEFRDPVGVVLDSKGDVWVADRNNGRIEEFSSTGGYLGKIGSPGSGNGQLDEPTALAIDSKGDIYVVDHGNNRIEEFSEKGEYIRQFNKHGPAELVPLSNPVGITLDSEGHVWVTQSCTIIEFTSEGRYLKEFGSCGGAGYPGWFDGVEGIASEGKSLWIADTGNNQLQHCTPSELTVSCSVVGSKGSGNGEFLDPTFVTLDAHGNLWVTDNGNNRVEELAGGEGHSYIQQFGEKGSGNQQLEGPAGIAVDSAGDVYVADSGNNRVVKWVVPPSSEPPPPAPPAKGTSSTWTVEYNAPLENNTELPEMGPNKETGKPEPAKWGQTDDPVYATAFFPPDEPMGWPAKYYKRATVSYFDSQARTVNAATPSGGVSTEEYNSENAVVRSLSPDNRATALKEECKSEKECKSAEVSQLLDTESTYSEGHLLETRGPQHMVKLAVGKEGKVGEEVLARNHVKYYYDQGAPKGETYDLVTKTEDDAETASKEEFDKRIAVTSYSGQENLGWKLRQPTSETTDYGGLNLESTTTYEENTGAVKETTSPAGNGAHSIPLYSSQFGKWGTEGGQINNANGLMLDPSGNVWVSDSGNNRIEELSSTGTFIQTLGWGVSNGKAEFQICKSSCQAGIAGAGNGQFSGPQGIAYDPHNKDVYVTDGGNDRVEVFTLEGAFVKAFGEAGSGKGQLNSPHGLVAEEGGNIWVADQSNSRLEEFTPEGAWVATIGKEGKGNGEFSGSGDVTLCNGDLYATDYAGQRVEEFSTSGTYLGKFGSTGKENGQFTQISRIACDTKNNRLYVTDKSGNRVEEFSAGGAFLSSFGVSGSGNGQFSTPIGVAVTTANVVYVLDNGNNRIQKWKPGNSAAHTTKTIYYTAKGEAEVATCREHPEWAGLPCQTTPAAQPGTSGLPELPTKTITYNMWDQAASITETFGSTTRTLTTTFDSAGRPLTTEESSSNDKSLPKVTSKYNTTNGALEQQSTTVGEETKTLTSLYNTLGELTEYTDADGNKAKYTYDEDGRVTKINDGSDEGKGEQSYTYNETSGMLTKLVDSGAGTFTASYDVQGKMTTESYPNGMTAYYTYNPIGTATALEYKKLTDCTEKCTWFSDSIVPSIHGETMKQASTLSEEPTYTYDGAGRLTQVQEIPTGEGCTTRLYAYEENSNRMSLTTRKPGTEGKCATEGGSSEPHIYDTGNRLDDPGVSYEAFGNITYLPATDTGGSAGSEITSEYYVDSQVYKQTQNKETSEYKVDPEDRTRETISNGEKESHVITHYDGPGSSPAWTSEEAGKKWTREIPGIGGELAAIQTSSTTELQLHDLQGNIVGTVGDSETETKLLSKYNSTEFGVPQPGTTAPKYAWLGAAGVAGEPSGVVVQDGITYVPQIGASLQAPQDMAPGDPSNYATSYTSAIAPWVAASTAATAAELTSKREQEISEREMADTPPGAVPSPEGEAGGGGGGGGCSGMDACAASVHEGFIQTSQHGNNGYGCLIWGSWGAGEFLAGEISGWGHWECGAVVPGFEMQIEAYGEGAPEFEGHKVRLGETGHKITKPFPSGRFHGEFEHTWKCLATGSWYHLWVWGRQLGTHGATQWSAAGWEREVGSCTKQGPVDFSPVGEGASES
jgi:YD repeat-containing protein